MGIGVQYGGHEMIFAFLESSAAFGTGMADSSTPVEHSGDPIIFVPDFKIRTRNAYRGQNWDDGADLVNDSKGALPSCVISGPAIKTELPDFLYALFQNVTEVETTPFQKTFNFLSPAPDFSADTGYYMTAWGVAPVASQHEKIDSLIAEKLEFTLNPESNDGNLFMSATMKGIGYSATANMTGTPGKSAFVGFNAFDVKLCQLDSTDLIPEEIKITFENVIKGVGWDDTLDTYASLALVRRACTVEIKGMWDAVTRAGLVKFGSGAETLFQLTFGATGVSGYLDFTIRGRVANANLAEEELRSVNLTLNGASDLAGTQEMAIVSIADAVDRAW